VLDNLIADYFCVIGTFAKKSKLVNSQGQSHKHSHAQKQQNDQTAEQRKLQPCLKKKKERRKKREKASLRRPFQAEMTW